MVFDFLVKAAERFVGPLDRHIDRGIEVFVRIADDDGLRMGDVDVELDADPFFLFGDHHVDGRDIKMIAFEIFNGGGNMIVQMLGKFDLFGANLYVHGQSFFR